MILELNDMMH